jgi:hypothetical protein
MSTLTPEQLATFKREGFLLLENAITPDMPKGASFFEQQANA